MSCPGVTMTTVVIVTPGQLMYSLISQFLNLLNKFKNCEMSEYINFCAIIFFIPPPPPVSAEAMF